MSNHNLADTAISQEGGNLQLQDVVSLFESSLASIEGMFQIIGWATVILSAVFALVSVLVGGYSFVLARRWSRHLEERVEIEMHQYVRRYLASPEMKDFIRDIVVEYIENSKLIQSQEDGRLKAKDTAVLEPEGREKL